MATRPTESATQIGGSRAMGDVTLGDDVGAGDPPGRAPARRITCG
jgi:hypothetical protein